MNGADVEKVYRQCLKREIDRERMWRKSKRCGNIRNSVHILDFEAAEAAEDSPSWISDGGKGVEDIIDACDRAAPGAEGTEAPLDCGCEPNRRRRDRIVELLERLHKTKEGERERSPVTPKEKGEETYTNNPPHARARRKQLSQFMNSGNSASWRGETMRAQNFFSPRK